MSEASLRVLKVLLWFVCAFHVLVGLGLNLWPGFPQIMAGYYGASAEWTPQFVYILKPLGVFMFALGILAAGAARNPLGNGLTIYAFAVVFIMRAGHRILLGPVVHDAFQISASRNTFNAVFFLTLAIVLVVLYRLASGKTARGATAAA